jgi:NADH-ubiquinone oxidoreductase chain 4
MHKSFLVTCLCLLITLILCFGSSNIVHFYIWFEASLIPTVILIMIWGYQPERIQARIYFIVYTVVASLPLLIIICKIYYSSFHLSIFYPWIRFPRDINQYLISLLIIAAFLVKLPLFSVHLWLPKAHVEAPVAGSIILAAILLKLGGYGLIRIITLFPQNCNLLRNPVISVAIIGAIITRIICLRQTDFKALIAYSSVGHIGLLIAGIISNTTIGLYGRLAIIIAHGLVSSALFRLANITYEQTHTRNISLTKGILVSLPIISIWWFLLVRANMAAPPSINLLREIILITGIISHRLTLAVPVIAVRFFTVAYSLYLYSTLNHGSPIIISNPISRITLNYSLLLIIHLGPVIIIIIIANYITNIYWYRSWLTTLNCKFKRMLVHRYL